MRYRQLGRTPWKVSEISFGAWAIGCCWGAGSDGGGGKDPALRGERGAGGGRVEGDRVSGRADGADHFQLLPAAAGGAVFPRSGAAGRGDSGAGSFGERVIDRETAPGVA